MIDRGKRTLQNCPQELAKKGNFNPRPISTLLKQGLAVATHNVNSARLNSLASHVNGAVCVVTGDSDILVHPKNAALIADGLKIDPNNTKSGLLLTLPVSGHGANEQWSVEIGRALVANIERGKNELGRRNTSVSRL